MDNRLPINFARFKKKTLLLLRAIIPRFSKFFHILTNKKIYNTLSKATIKLEISIDNIKREYFTTLNKTTWLRKLYLNYDMKEYSFYWMQYINSSQGGKILFITNNLFIGMLNSMRSNADLANQAFGTMGIYGQEDDHVIRGLLIFSDKAYKAVNYI